MKLYDLRAYNQKFMVHRYKANSCFRLPLRSMHVPCAMWIINLLALQGIISYTSQPLLAFLQLLKRPEYFSKFGKIHKIVVNNSTNYAGPQVSQFHSETCKCDQFQMLNHPPQVSLFSKTTESVYGGPNCLDFRIMDFHLLVQKIKQSG